MRRLFTAFPLPGDFAEAVDAAVRALRAGASDPQAAVRLAWLPRASRHMTLHFLGDIEDSSAALAESLTRRLALPIVPLVFSPQGLVWLPDAGKPRVLALAFTARQPDLVLRILQAARIIPDTLGIPPERRPWRAHITLARVRGGAADAGEYLVPGRGLPEMPVPEFAPESLILMESFLRREGPEYRIVARCPTEGIRD